MNLLFQNAIRRNSQKIPPIWFMRQAGRYHSHYQGLRQQYTFEQLCRQPELAAQVALGPIMDFDYDVSILFSDILFPLDGLGFELSYSDAGPKLQKSIKTGYRYSSLQAAEALAQLAFQAEALKITREVLPKDKSLIGFVGGLWTLFVYACEGGHAGAMTFAKNEFIQSEDLVHTLAQVICGNIEMQLKAGAEVAVMLALPPLVLTQGNPAGAEESKLTVASEKFRSELAKEAGVLRETATRIEIARAAWLASTRHNGA